MLRFDEVALWPILLVQQRYRNKSNQIKLAILCYRFRFKTNKNAKKDTLQQRIDTFFSSIFFQLAEGGFNERYEWSMNVTHSVLTMTSTKMSMSILFSMSYQLNQPNYDSLTHHFRSIPCNGLVHVPKHAASDQIT